jgi:hypothetical protein
MTAEQILRDALSLIEDRDHWVNRGPALYGGLSSGGATALRYENGQPIDTHWAHPQATRWCLGGALSKACGHVPNPNLDEDEHQGVGCPNLQAHLVAVALIEELTGYEYEQLNEVAEHAAIVTALREGIELLRIT